MAIAFDAAIGGIASFATTITTSLTVASGSDRALFGFGCTRNNGTTVSGQTFNGDALSAVSGAEAAGGTTGNPCNAKCFALAPPDVATGNFVTTLNNANSSQSVHIAMSYTGVDQSTPTVGGAGTSGISNSIPLTLDPDAAGDWLVGATFINTASFHTILPAGTTVTRINTTQNRVGGDEPATSGSAQVLEWTGVTASDPWRVAGFVFKQVAAAGGLPSLVGLRGFHLAAQRGLAG